MTAVGDVLKSNDPDRPDLQVLGATEAGEWIVSEADEFGSARTIESDEIVAYGVDSAPERRSEVEGWKKLGEATHRRPVLPARPLTPEQALAQGEGTPVTALAADGSVFTPGESKKKGQSGPWAAVTFSGEA